MDIGLSACNLSVELLASDGGEDSELDSDSSVESAASSLPMEIDVSAAELEKKVNSFLEVKFPYLLIIYI